MDEEESEPVGPKGVCPCDDPSQSFQVYSDGHGYCFAGGCPHPRWSPKKLAGAGWEVDPEALAGETYEPRSRARVSEDLQELIASSDIRALELRKITQATCKHWDYRVRVTSDNQPQHLATYRDEHGQLVAIKMRTGNGLDFPWVGDRKAVSLYGIHLLGKTGKKVIITEGEIDCMSVSQLWGNKFPVLSLANGSKGAKGDVAKALARLSAFDEVVLCFDMDEPGQKAALEVAKMLPVGKAFIVQLPRKDANEMLKAGEGAELMSLIHKATPYRPAGVISTHDLRGKALEAPTWGLRMGIPFLDNLQWGWRDGEVLVQGAGTGMGKSDTAMQVCAHLIRPREEDQYPGTRCGFINYEQSDPQTTMKGIAGKLFEKRFDRPDPDGLYWTQPELEKALAYMDEACARVYFNDEDMPRGWEPFEELVRYLFHAEGVTRFFGDPMAAFAADMEDERKGLDQMMAHAKDLCKELGVGIWFNSHLARPKDGPSHEEGGHVRMSNFRGSGAITMWADLVWGIERNQQEEDPVKRALTTYRSLKCRKAGEKVGETGSFVYNVLTGILEPATLALTDQSTGPLPTEEEPFQGYIEP